jgi:hypothetical protein
VFSTRDESNANPPVKFNVVINESPVELKSPTGLISLYIFTAIVRPAGTASELSRIVTLALTTSPTPQLTVLDVLNFEIVSIGFFTAIS